MLNDEIVLRIVLEEFNETQLLHPHEVLLGEAEFVFEGRVEFVDVGCIPSVLVVGGVQLDLLAGDVEVGGIRQGDEVDREDLVPVPEEDGVDD
jgi:hypothetical protein